MRSWTLLVLLLYILKAEGVRFGRDGTPSRFENIRLGSDSSLSSSNDGSSGDDSYIYSDSGSSGDNSYIYSDSGSSGDNSVQDSLLSINGKHAAVSLSQTKPATSSSAAAPNGLRPLHIPKTVTDEFLKAAHANTATNIETGAWLFGSLTDWGLVVNMIVIPPQTGFRDHFVQSDHDDDVLVRYSEMGLLPLGWIHTHPVWDSYLSGIDMHMQLSFQLSFVFALFFFCTFQFLTISFFIINL